MADAIDTYPGAKHASSAVKSAETAHLDKLLDEALKQTFPATDPLRLQ
jgi:hypothetical protein